MFYLNVTMFAVTDMPIKTLRMENSDASVITMFVRWLQGHPALACRKPRLARTPMH